MSAVYSRRFCDAPSVSGGPYNAYTVPAGMLAVVKCLTITWGNVFVSGLDAWFETSVGTKIHRQTYAAGLTLPTVGGSASFYGSWVIPETESLFYQAQDGVCDFHASGFLFELP